MDLHSLHQALASTLSPNQQEREAAEAGLKALQTTPGYLNALFHVVSSTEAEGNVRQAGAIYFKNLVLKQWGNTESDAGEEGAIVFAEEEKASVRGLLLESLVNATDKTRAQIVECVRKISAVDFPEKMPGFVQQITQWLDPALPPQQLFAATLALRALVKNFEYKSMERRIPLNEIMAHTFPRLVPIMEVTLNAPLGDEAAAEMQKAMIKTLWSCVHQSVPLYLQNGDIFMQWMSLLYRVIERGVPPSVAGGTGQDVQEISKSVFWKCRRWAAQIMHRLFQKYGNPKATEKQMTNNGTDNSRLGEVQLSRAFHDHLTQRFLQLFMQILSTKVQGAFLPDRFVVEAINYIVISVTLAITWKDLQPNVMPLVCQVLFPIMCFDEADEEMWTDDPQEFIRKTYDVMEDYTSPRVAGCNLIIDLCEKRTKTCMMPILEFCAGHFNAYQASDRESARRKDGAMYVVGSLSEQLQKAKVAEQYKPQLTWLLSSHVVADLQANVGHLRGRACWMLSKFVKTIETDADFFQRTVTAIMGLLRDPELPVRFQAAVALRHLIYDEKKSCAREAVSSMVGTVLPDLLQELFNLMDQFGSDELVSTLEVLIESYADQMGPYAQGLCQRLSNHFIKLASLTGDEADEESSLAACQCCSAITTLLDSIKKTPEIYHTLEFSLIPVLAKVLSPDQAGEYNYMEFMEDALEILTYLLVELVCDRFASKAPKKELLRTEMLKMLSNCMYYNAEATLMLLEGKGATGHIFQQWFMAILASDEAEEESGEKIKIKTHFKGVHDKKVCILGLASVLRVPTASMPPSVQTGVGHILAALVTLLEDIAAAKQRKAEREAAGEGDDDEDSDDDAGFDVDDDCDQVPDEGDMDAVLAKLSQLREGGTWDDLFGDDDDEDEDEYTSPIDDVDELLFFAEGFQALQGVLPPDQFQQLTATCLTPEQAQKLQELLASVPQRAQEVANRKAQEEALKAAAAANAQKQ